MTNPKWRNTDLSPMAGRHVVLLPDHDEPGEAHMESLAEALHKLGAMVRVLALDGLPDKGDVSDWLDAGHDGEELVRLAEEAPEWEPTPEPVDDGVDDDDDDEVITRKRRLTELGNAERLVDAYGVRLRYNVTTGGWMLWDGRRWAVD